MIEGIIDAVRQAEEQAKEISAGSQRDARDAARAVTDQASVEAAQILDAARAQAQTAVQAAETQARKEADAFVQTKSEQIDRQRAQAQTRESEAVSLILERIPTVWR